MKILQQTPEAIVLALNILHEGGVIAHATETCYGLACDLSNVGAVQKLFAIKQRPAEQPVSALFASVEEAKKYVEWNAEAQNLADEYLPGPLTMILKMRKNSPKRLFPMVKSETRNSKLESNVNEKISNIPQGNQTQTFGFRISDFGFCSTLGIRLSSHPLAQQLVQTFGSPLSTTSANIHGQPNPYSAEDIATQFADAKVQPDLILDSGTLPQNPPSTVINLTNGKETKRQGNIHLKL